MTWWQIQGKWYTRTKGYFLRSCEVYNNPFESKSGYIKISRRSRSFNMCTGLSGGIFSLKHESSIFRSFIQPCMPVLHGTNSTEPNLFHHGETTCRVGWLIWICYSPALERRCLISNGKNFATEGMGCETWGSNETEAIFPLAVCVG